MGSEKRQRQSVVALRLTESEKEQIKVNAAGCGLSVSSYLRTLGLGYTPTSRLDLTAVRSLAKLNGDQGRLGGLLKMWLTNDERQTDAINHQVNKTLIRIASAQEHLLKVIESL